MKPLPQATPPAEPPRPPKPLELGLVYADKADRWYLAVAARTVLAPWQGGGPLTPMHPPASLRRLDPGPQSVDLAERWGVSLAEIDAITVQYFKRPRVACPVLTWGSARPRQGTRSRDKQPPARVRLPRLLGS